MQRPLGVTVVALLILVGGVGFLLGGLLVVGYGLAAGGQGIDAGAYVGLGAFAVALGALDLAAGIGLWRLTRRGWQLGLAVSLLAIAFALTAFVVVGDAATAALSVVVPALILAYLLPLRERFPPAVDPRAEGRRP